MAAPEERAGTLRSLLNHHNRKYYVEHAPEITDNEYDRLMNELKQLEAEYPELKTPDSPTQRVGESPADGFEKIQHRIPMLSIENTYSRDELAEFDGRVRKLLGHDEYTYAVELKIDGLAVALWYEKGILVRGVTRGNGIEGDDITQNIKTVFSIPMSLSDAGTGIPPFLDIRGEVYMEKRTLEKLNTQRAENGENLFINTRNAAAGSLKLLNSRITAERKLQAFIHSVGNTDFLPEDATHSGTLELFEKMGLPVNPHSAAAENIDGVIAYCDSWEGKRKELGYDTDGIVVKVNELRYHGELGATAKAPRWIIAYKYQAEQKETVVKEVVIQVGKTGILTPVAILEPVFISGSTVSKSSLHNLDEIISKDIRIGDHVIIEKAGEIIPQVVRSLPEKRDGSESKVAYPETCPECGSPSRKDAEGVYVRCTNIECPAQVKANILFYGSVEAMNIDGLGVSLVDALYENGLVRNIADLYELSSDSVAGLERMGEKSALNLIAGIEKSKNRGLARFLTAIGIRNIGKTSAEILASRFRSLQVLMDAGIEELEDIDGIGPVLAKSIRDFFETEKNREILRRLSDAGVKTELDTESQAGVFSGKTFVITGSLPSMGRKEVQTRIEELGGRTSSSVSSKTDFLIVGESPGSKYDKAVKLGVEILTEEQFLEMIKGG